MSLRKDMSSETCHNPGPQWPGLVSALCTLPGLVSALCTLLTGIEFSYSRQGHRSCMFARLPCRIVAWTLVSLWVCLLEGKFADGDPTGMDVLLPGVRRQRSPLLADRHFSTWTESLRTNEGMPQDYGSSRCKYCMCVSLEQRVCPKGS